jgi:hypothetical protein
MWPSMRTAPRSPSAEYEEHQILGPLARFGSAIYG